MPHYKIQISDLAKEDLEDIGDYITFTLQNPQAALNTLKVIHQKILNLKYFPNEMLSTQIPN